MKLKSVFIANILLLAVLTVPAQDLIREPYPLVSGSFSGVPVAQSPDPLVAYRWANPRPTDDLEIYTLKPLKVQVDSPANATVNNPSSVKVSGECNLMFDFGQVNAAWFEFDSDNLDGDIELSISEYNEPAILNAGAQNPIKTAKPVRYGNTWRLELNKELYEGVRFAWIHIRKLNHPAEISSARLVCQIKPTNYEGSFACSDTMLTRIWYTGAYDVKLNLLKDFYGAILMERSDRHSWTGDAHPSQAASMVAFGNYDFVKANLRYTSTQFNGIASYSLYWALSLIDYYNYTGDRELFDEMLTNTCAKLDAAYKHYGSNPGLSFYGWDERIGAGFENSGCTESQNAYRMLSIRAWNEYGAALSQAGYTQLSAKYRQYAEEKIALLRKDAAWEAPLGVHAAADAVNAGFTDGGEQDKLWKTAFADRMQRVSYSPFNQYFIIQSMSRMQRHAEALNTVDDCWGGQIRYGATTFFEVFRPSWNDISRPNDAPVNNQCGYTSLTHPWSAGVTKWLSEEVLGVKPSSPGFATFTFKPYLSAKITWIKGSVPTLHGIIKVAFNALTGDGEVSVPSGTTATVGIPKSGRTVVSVKFKGKQAAVKAGEDDRFIYYSGLMAGNHQIKVKYKGSLQADIDEPLTYAGGSPALEDGSTQGNWQGKYGSKGYMFFNYDSLNNRSSLPDWAGELVIKKAGHAHWANSTSDIRALPTDIRALSSSDKGAGEQQRSIGAIITRDPNACDQTMTVDIPSRAGISYKLSLYFVDWDSEGRRSAIEVFDLSNMNLLMPVYMVRDYVGGK
ncbi:MAG: hypothetical protein LBT35_00950, partial [Tannerella sp.]|nr:hypothetical protein [Tannerella sp.]